MGNFLYDLFSGLNEGFQRSFQSAQDEAREGRRYQRYGEALTQSRKETMQEEDRLRREREAEKRQADLEAYLELGRGYGEEWDFTSPGAAREYYEKSFLPERERERKESERFYRRQELSDIFQRQGMAPDDAETHAGIASAYPNLYRLLFPQPKAEDPTRHEDRLFRQRVQAVEDTLLDQIPNYFSLRPEDRSALVGQVESYTRRGLPWHVAQDEAGNPVIMPGVAPSDEDTDNDDQEVPEGVTDPYGGRVPPEAGLGDAILNALGELLSGGSEGGYGLYSPPPSGERGPTETKQPTRQQPTTKKAVPPRVRGIKRIQ